MCCIFTHLRALLLRCGYWGRSRLCSVASNATLDASGLDRAGGP